MQTEPVDFKREKTTSWSFPVRGNWATHNPKYRGNFAPQIARNLILHYSHENETVLDPMVGSGTTLIEAKLLHRNAVGIDINKNAVDLSKQALSFNFKTKTKQEALLGDARNLHNFYQNYFDLIIIHPPYLNIVKYSDGHNKNDLSSISNLSLFLMKWRLLPMNSFEFLSLTDTVLYLLVILEKHSIIFLFHIMF